MPLRSRSFENVLKLEKTLNNHRVHDNDQYGRKENCDESFKKVEDALCLVNYFPPFPHFRISVINPRSSLNDSGCKKYARLDDKGS